MAAGALVAGVLLLGAPVEAPVEPAIEELPLAHLHSMLINTR